MPLYEVVKVEMVETVSSQLIRADSAKEAVVKAQVLNFWEECYEKVNDVEFTAENHGE